MVSALMFFAVKKKKKEMSFNTLCCYSCTLKNNIFKVNVIQNKLCDEELYNSHVFEIIIIMPAWTCIACLVKLSQSLIIGTKKSIPPPPKKTNAINNKQRTIYENHLLNFVL
jgi:hypothetical protein